MKAAYALYGTLLMLGSDSLCTDSTCRAWLHACACSTMQGLPQARLGLTDTRSVTGI